MSHIAFNARFVPFPGFAFRISGCERAYIADLARSHALVPEVVGWLHQHCERGGWVRREDLPAFASAIRGACESSVCLGNGRACALRVGMSSYGAVDMERRYDRAGETIQSWWSLADWLMTSPGDIVLSYSVTGLEWPEEALTETGFRLWLEEYGGVVWSP